MIGGGRRRLLGPRRVASRLTAAGRRRRGGVARPAPSGRRARGAPSAGRRPARRRAGRPGWPTNQRRRAGEGGDRDDGALASRISAEHAAAAAGGPLRGRSRPRAARGPGALVVTAGADAVAPGRRPDGASRRLTGSRRASTRIGVGEPVDRPAAHHLVVVLERLRDQVDGPGHGKGDEDQCAEVHESEVRSLARGRARMSTGVSQNNSCDWCDSSHARGRAGPASRPGTPRR